MNQLKLVTIDHIAVGTLHCIAVSTQGDVSFNIYQSKLNYLNCIIYHTIMFNVYFLYFLKVFNILDLLLG